MSLRVWLPLNGNLDNQGLDQVIVTNNGAVVDNNGKIGKCYSFSGSNYITVQEVNLPNIWSYCCWLYSEVSSRSWEVVMTCNNNGGDADMQLGLYTCPSGNKIQNTANGQYNSSISMTYGQWNHFVGTFDGSNLKTYLNGILVNTKTITNTKLDRPKLTIGARCRGSSYDCYFKGKLNDIRIYDHALSPLEVKQISQGLILHYPLNRNGWGNENLLKYTQVNALNKNLLRTNISTIWDKLTLTTKDGYDCYLYPMAQSSTWFSSSTWYRLKANTVYTYSAYIYFTQNANFSFSSLGHFQVYNSASTASDKAHEDIVSARIYEPSTIQANEWTKIRITFTTNNLADSGFIIYPRYNISTNVGDLYIRNFKLEEGAIATPWCPNSADELYNTLGLNDNIQYDTSGYGNNGTKTGTFSWTSDTPKYQVSSVFDSSSIIDTPVIITSTSLISQYTAAAWIKRNNTDTTNNHCFFTGPIELFIQGSTSHIRFYWSHATSTSSMVNNTWNPSVTINNSIWTHIVVTFADGVLKCYINGELSNTSDRSSTGQYIYGNKYHTIGSYHDTTEKFIGQICDVRAYATALSAEDVKSLYQNSAYIDNQGNIYGAIYEEV